MKNVWDEYLTFWVIPLIVKINENYIKIHRYQKGQLLFLKSSFHLVEHELYSLYFA